MLEFVRKWRWSVIAPLLLLGGALLWIFVLDQESSGEAEPPELLGELRSPVRGTFVPPTATPPGARRTPRPRPTVAGVSGDPVSRDATRRADVLRIVQALQQVKEREGEYPSTNNNIQSLCVYRDIDVGCDLADALGGEVPSDPLGTAAENGYWYQSDGERAKVYVALEGDIPDSERCDTDYVEFEDKVMICPEVR
jgi:hypothetical protein